MKKLNTAKSMSLILVLAMISMMLFQIPGMAKNSEEMLENTGFEDGLDPWIGKGPKIEVVTDVVHSGKAAVKASGRGMYWDNVNQDVTDLVTEYGKGEYNISAWGRMATGNDNIEAVIKIVSDESGELYFSVPGDGTPATSSAWIKDSKVVNLTWDGELLAANFYVQTKDTSTDFYVDDCSMTKVLGSTGAEPTKQATPTPKAATATPKATTTTPKATAAPNTTTTASEASTSDTDAAATEAIASDTSASSEAAATQESDDTTETTLAASEDVSETSADDIDANATDNDNTQSGSIVWLILAVVVGIAIILFVILQLKKKKSA